MFFSQKFDSIKELKTFEKTTSKLLLNDVFLKSDNLNPVNDRQNESISTIIEQETTTYIKSYSPGNLSSISIREVIHSKHPWFIMILF